MPNLSRKPKPNKGSSENGLTPTKLLFSIQKSISLLWTQMRMALRTRDRTHHREASWVLFSHATSQGSNKQGETRDYQCLISMDPLYRMD